MVSVSVVQGLFFFFFFLRFSEGLSSLTTQSALLHTVCASEDLSLKPRNGKKKKENVSLSVGAGDKATDHLRDLP